MRQKMLVIAGVLVILGVAAFLLQPGPPDPVCAPAGATQTSGAVDESGCAITIESFNEIREYETSPKPFRIGGLVLVLGGVVVAVVGMVRGRSKPA